MVTNCRYLYILICTFKGLYLCCQLCVMNHITSNCKVTVIYTIITCEKRRRNVHIFFWRFKNSMNEKICTAASWPISYYFGWSDYLYPIKSMYIRDNFFTHILIYLLPDVCINSLEHLEDFCWIRFSSLKVKVSEI